MILVQDNQGYAVLAPGDLTTPLVHEIAATFILPRVETALQRRIRAFFGTRRFFRYAVDEYLGTATLTFSRRLAPEVVHRRGAVVRIEGRTASEFRLTLQEVQVLQELGQTSYQPSSAYLR